MLSIFVISQNHPFLATVSGRDVRDIHHHLAVIWIFVVVMLRAVLQRRHEGIISQLTRI